MGTVIEKIAWAGWPNCYRIANDEVEIVVTSDIGPRIMHYSFQGGRNFFKIFESQKGKSGEPDWQTRGGHRIWVAPETRERTYAPDNGAVSIEIRGTTLVATQPVELLTGIRKQLVIDMAAAGTEVTVLHRLQNTLPFAQTFAPWALSMLTPGGTGITGFPARGRHEDHLSPTNPLVMWAFTNLTDKRWTFLEKYLVLRHDPAAPVATKLGHFNPDTWGAYLLGSELFLKRYKADPSGTYPDMGCSWESFANADMLEIETLGPLAEVAPGDWLEHTERWSLHRDITVPEWTDAGLDRALSATLV
ncbi:MAG: hypothetical protein ABJC09_12775 [Terriglobia bacterium]